ncbi:MAG TPA: antibiotic biosynthesis monooxygenase, partial [Leptolyngbyaceae cyanobacterium M65_K2018_010]|nr:antibiotic biosynthesis monooxygenase [Leptolyngbyaceae cyanobacterium M65_K2018_010]
MRLFKDLLKPLRGWGVALLIALATLGWPGAGWADKVASPLVFSGDEGAIAVISLYETTPEAQSDGVKALLKTSKSFYKKVPGFQSFALFSSVDGQRILELTQWQSQA